MRLHDVYGLSETHSPATMLLDHELARTAIGKVDEVSLRSRAAVRRSGS